MFDCGHIAQEEQNDAKVEKSEEYEELQRKAVTLPAEEDLDQTHNTSTHNQVDQQTHNQVTPPLVCVCEPCCVPQQACDSQQAMLVLDLTLTPTLTPGPQQGELVTLQPFEDDESREQDLSSSPTNTPTEGRYVGLCALGWGSGVRGQV